MEEIEGILELSKAKGIYIDIGTKLYLDIDGVSFSVTSIFVGMLKDEFLIITLPRRYKNIQNKLFRGNKMVVKYLFDGSVFAFQTSVIEMITNPIKALAVEYPKVVQEQELRVVKRNNVVIPSRINIDTQVVNVVVFDINKKGCCFKIQDKKVSLVPGDAITIFCKLPGSSTEITTKACVRNIRKEENYLSIGTEFEDLDRSFLDPLITFLFTIEDFA
ncbi:MAG: flagellar brake protein [Proteobacteria bacterium]|nr:flagellar brake protein [Desulfobacula sp.]MBU3951045.1 flagellar brake protein [Pseudomonadota bacterium]MBU4131255.1 flagellar brake protein [Pseudomonadota bacterium]